MARSFKMAALKGKKNGSYILYAQKRCHCLVLIILYNFFKNISWKIRRITSIIKKFYKFISNNHPNCRFFLKLPAALNKFSKSPYTHLSEYFGTNFVRRRKIFNLFSNWPLIPATKVNVICPFICSRRKHSGDFAPRGNAPVPLI